MKISELSDRDLAQRLAGDRLNLQTGPFVVRLQSSVRDISANLHVLYGANELVEEGAFADFHVRLDRPASPRRWIKPQVFFYLDGRVPFKPLPVSQAVPMLEWGMNWCIANHAHQYLIMHAAVVEKDGFAAVMPARPGSGKSTLAAALVSRGWRLLSDELGIVALDDGQMVALARPVNLKNESIPLLRRFSPSGVFSRPFEDTNKGTVALLRAPADSVEAGHTRATPAWIIQPQYMPDAEAELQETEKARMFMHVADNSFNYSVLGVQGFKALKNLIEGCACYQFTYSRLEQALEIFEALPRPEQG
jgi:HprK-related kinase A